MFTVDFRKHVRDHLVDRAEADQRLTGVAITGSGSAGNEDRFSDIDVAFGVDARYGLLDVIEDWTNHMRRRFEVIDHLDVRSRSTMYRVFLLANTLQVDIAFAPQSEFGAVAPTFRLVSGTATAQPAVATPEVGELIGLAWLYALHARSSLARTKLWQAEYMIASMRDRVVSLACLRFGLPPTQGRGVDQLPASLLDPLEATLPQALTVGALREAFTQTTELLIGEITQVDPARAKKLSPVLAEMVRTAVPPTS